MRNISAKGTSGRLQSVICPTVFRDFRSSKWPTITSLPLINLRQSVRVKQVRKVDVDKIYSKLVLCVRLLFYYDFAETQSMAPVKHQILEEQKNWYITQQSKEHDRSNVTNIGK